MKILTLRSLAEAEVYFYESAFEGQVTYVRPQAPSFSLPPASALAAPRHTATKLRFENSGTKEVEPCVPERKRGRASDRLAKVQVACVSVQAWDSYPEEGSPGA
jgi:hypothetical protein